MSVAPDPAELAPSRDPAAYGRRRLFTPGFLGWIVLCVICVAGGAALGRFGWAPQVKTPEQASDDNTVRPPPSPTSPAIVASPTPAPPASAAPAAAASATDAGLEGRVAKLEAAASHQDQAAALALAAASLSTAAEGSAPFDQDVIALERLAPGDPDLRALQPLAVLGAPSRAALAAALPNIASAAVVAVREPPRNAGFLDKLMAMLGRVVIIRRVDPNAPTVDGRLAKAEEQAAAGDVGAAAQTLRYLPPAARPVLADWLAAADRRVDIDRRVASIRARALATLSASQAPAAPPGPAA
jgi:hypothetical protein